MGRHNRAKPTIAGDEERLSPMRDRPVTGSYLPLQSVPEEVVAPKAQEVYSGVGGYQTCGGCGAQYGGPIRECPRGCTRQVAIEHVRPVTVSRVAPESPDEPWR
jgi:hypothetical protein